jgi:hypothetical protein
LVISGMQNSPSAPYLAAINTILISQPLRPSSTCLRRSFFRFLRLSNRLLFWGTFHSAPLGHLFCDILFPPNQLCFEKYLMAHLSSTRECDTLPLCRALRRRRRRGGGAAWQLTAAAAGREPGAGCCALWRSRRCAWTTRCWRRRDTGSCARWTPRRSMTWMCCAAWLRCRQTGRQAGRRADRQTDPA